MTTGAQSRSPQIIAGGDFYIPSAPGSSKSADSGPPEADRESPRLVAELHASPVELSESTLPCGTPRLDLVALIESINSAGPGRPSSVAQFHRWNSATGFGGAGPVAEFHVAFGCLALPHPVFQTSKARHQGQPLNPVQCNL